MMIPPVRWCFLVKIVQSQWKTLQYLFHQAIENLHLIHMERLCYQSKNMEGLCLIFAQ